MLSNHQQDYLDFCGNHQPDFSLMDAEMSDKFLNALANNSPFSTFIEIFKDTLDQLAYCAVHAFSIGRLTRAQMAIFLEYRTIKKYFAVEVINLNENNFGWFFEFARDNPNKAEKFTMLAGDMRYFAKSFFCITLDPENLDEETLEFITLLKGLNIISYQLIPPNQAGKRFAEIILINAELREILSKVEYGKHAKSALHRLGKFSLDNILDSMEKYGRAISVDYPGILPADSFHKIKSIPLFVILHDEVHRILISTIPNVLYSALLDAIKLVKEKTGIRWSREIWDATDMEVGIFLNGLFDYEKYDENHIKTNTKYFIELLNATVLTKKRSAGLFTATPYVDTTWILMIDMALNKEKWKKKGINLSTLSSINPYRLMHDFVLNNKKSIINISSPAKQVMIIKSTWFDLPLQDEVEVKFIKEAKSPRHIMVKVNDQPIHTNKMLALTLVRMSLIEEKGNVFLSLSDFKIYDPVAFQAFVKVKYGNSQPSLAELAELLSFQNLPSGSTHRNAILKAILKFTNCTEINFSFPKFTDDDLHTIFSVLFNEKKKFQSLCSSSFGLFSNASSQKISDLLSYAEAGENTAEQIVGCKLSGNF